MLYSAQTCQVHWFCAIRLSDRGQSVPITESIQIVWWGFDAPRSRTRWIWIAIWFSHKSKCVHPSNKCKPIRASCYFVLCFEASQLLLPFIRCVLQLTAGWFLTAVFIRASVNAAFANRVPVLVNQELCEIIAVDVYQMKRENCDVRQTAHQGLQSKRFCPFWLRGWWLIESLIYKLPCLFVSMKRVCIEFRTGVNHWLCPYFQKSADSKMQGRRWPCIIGKVFWFGLWAESHNTRVETLQLEKRERNWFFLDWVLSKGLHQPKVHLQDIIAPRGALHAFMNVTFKTANVTRGFGCLSHHFSRTKRQPFSTYQGSESRPMPSTVDV